MYRAGGQLLLVCKVDLIGPNVLGGQSIRRRAEVACEQRYLLEIRCLRMRRQIPHLHVLGHPLSKNGHVKRLLRYESAASSASTMSQTNFVRNIGRSDHGTEAATSHYREAV